MNSTRRPPSENEIDRLLASQFKDTTPEFERRWVDLKRQLRTAPQPHSVVRPWAAWLGLVSAGVAIALVVALLPPRRPADPQAGAEPSTALAELFAMDEVLARATPLLDDENRDALLHLPANPSRHS